MFERWRDLWDSAKLARMVVLQQRQIESLDKLLTEYTDEVDKAVQVANEAVKRQVELASELASERSAHRLAQVRLEEALSGLESARSALEAKEDQRKWEVGRELDRRRLVERELADLKNRFSDEAER